MRKLMLLATALLGACGGAQVRLEEKVSDEIYLTRKAGLCAGYEALPREEKAINPLPLWCVLGFSNETSAFVFEFRGESPRSECCLPYLTAGKAHWYVDMDTGELFGRPWLELTGGTNL